MFRPGKHFGFAKITVQRSIIRLTIDLLETFNSNRNKVSFDVIIAYYISKRRRSTYPLNVSEIPNKKNGSYNFRYSFKDRARHIFTYAAVNKRKLFFLVHRDRQIRCDPVKVVIFVIVFLCVNT